MIKRLALLALFIPLPLLAGPPDSWMAVAHERHLAEDPGWLALLHMETNIFFLQRSAVDDPIFFISPRGMKDPSAELDATLTALATPVENPDDSAQCRFPARRQWLEEKLGITFDLPVQSCARFQSWREKMAPEGVSLVFASYYFNNPASMYGHTFLKLKRQGYEEGKGLLDYTVNYAAEANTANGMAFAAKGLLGGYKGRFSTDPYYIKIQKYNNMESRDLWEYDLNLSSAQIERLVAHLWELGPTAITYFFFNKNCSYQLMPVLDAVEPSLKLSREFRIRTIPLDTIVAVLSRPNFTRSPRLRPSHVRTMLARRHLLSEPEANLAKSLGENPTEARQAEWSGLEPARRALVAESSLDYFRYKTGFLRDRPPSVADREQKLLLLRKNAGAATPALSFGGVAPPESAHKTGRVSLLVGADRRQGFEEIGIRSALHDQESDSTGYVSGSQLEMIHIRARYYNADARFRLENFTMIDVLSLVPRDPWVHPPSWRVWIGADQARDITDDTRQGLAYGIKGGSGFSWGILGLPKSIFYAMWRSEAELGTAFEDGYRVGFGGQSGIVLPLARRARIHFEADALRFPIGNVGNTVRFNGTVSLSLTQNSEIRVIGERQNHNREARTGIFIYW